MTTLYFGPRWDSGRLDDARQVPTPVGQPCVYCTEPIADGDRGLIIAVMRDVDTYTSEPGHADCDMLGVLGHLHGVCSCSGFDPGSRAAARELWKRVEARRGRSFDIPGG